MPWIGSIYSGFCASAAGHRSTELMITKKLHKTILEYQLLEMQTGGSDNVLLLAESRASARRDSPRRDVPGHSVLSSIMPSFASFYYARSIHSFTTFYGVRTTRKDATIPLC